MLSTRPGTKSDSINTKKPSWSFSVTLQMHMRGTCLRPAVGQLEQSEQQRLRGNYSPRWKAGRRGATVLTPGRRPAEVELRGAARSGVSPARFLPNWLQPGRSEWNLEVCPQPQPEETEALPRSWPWPTPNPGRAASACSPLRPHSFQKKQASARRLLCPDTTKRRKRPRSPNDATALGDCSSSPVSPRATQGGRLRP